MKPRLFWWAAPLGVFTVGALLLAAGFAYDSTYAGVYHRQVAARMMKGGAMTAIVGFLSLCLVAAWLALRRLASKLEGPDER